MKKVTILFVSLLLTQIGLQAQEWAPAGDKIKTSWAAEVKPTAPLQEYPRPQMVRKEWQNLNGLWNYAIQPKEAGKPATFSGKILVPFAVESSLSGVGKTVGKDSILWYNTTFSVPRAMAGKAVLLHFGAVDWETEVWVNGQSVGTHKGGYDPFSFDITNALKKGSNTLEVRVWDPSDDGPQPRGKQVKKPSGIWYTPVTGIWQTVWLEGVPKTYIAATKQTPDLDNSLVRIKANVENMQSSDQVKISAWDGANKIGEETVNGGEEATINIKDPKVWSGKNPFLYDLKISVVRKGKVVDEVDSYFAMRKISMAPDQHGVQRMLLNNEFVFQYGPLDQGWWPDGLYTAPTDAALKYDIDITKEMGFNMIRKHVKVEPARWYYYADKAGMLVWQDMPSGDLGNRWDSRPGIMGRATDKERTAESEAIYRTEWAEIMKDLHNFPSIVVWVPFNEAWGQFKTTPITEWTVKNDPSRLVNSASGGNFELTGHILDLHNYPEPAMPDAQMFGKQQIVVLGEFGGLGLPVEGHTWQEKNNWGYQSFKNNGELWERYSNFIDRLPALIEKGLSAAVYTQTTDVEVETNGLLTYDRKEIKMPVEKLAQLHAQLYSTPSVTVKAK